MSSFQKLHLKRHRTYPTFSGLRSIWVCSPVTWIKEQRGSLNFALSSKSSLDFALRSNFSLDFALSSKSSMHFALSATFLIFADLWSVIFDPRWSLMRDLWSVLHFDPWFLIHAAFSFFLSFLSISSSWKKDYITQEVI